MDSDPDPDPEKAIEVDPDPDLDPDQGSKWIRIRPNVVDPGRSGSKTLLLSSKSSVFVEMQDRLNFRGFVEMQDFSILEVSFKCKLSQVSRLNISTKMYPRGKFNHVGWYIVY